jgi:hypothetical protein
MGHTPKKAGLIKLQNLLMLMLPCCGQQIAYGAANVLVAAIALTLIKQFFNPALPLVAGGWEIYLNQERFLLTQPDEYRIVYEESEVSMPRLITLDKFGNLWDNQPPDKCPICGQPDNCGDCNHKRLADSDVLELGGVPNSQLKLLFT